MDGRAKNSAARRRRLPPTHLTGRRAKPKRQPPASQHRHLAAANRTGGRTHPSLPIVCRDRAARPTSSTRALPRQGRPVGTQNRAAGARCALAGTSKAVATQSTTSLSENGDDDDDHARTCLTGHRDRPPQGRVASQVRRFGPRHAFVAVVSAGVLAAAAVAEVPRG
jgi:hypothetical protein